MQKRIFLCNRRRNGGTFLLKIPVKNILTFGKIFGIIYTEVKLKNKASKGEKTMKRILSLVLAAVLLCGCVFALASCGNKPSGTYVGEIDMGLAKGSLTYEFKGNSFKATVSGEALGGLVEGSSQVQEGTYEIVEKDDGKLEIVFTFTSEDGKTEVSPAASYEKGEDYIKIDGVKLTKKDK